MFNTSHRVLQRFGTFAFAAMLALAATSAVHADFSNAAFAPVENVATSIPVGHAEFCSSHRAECGANAPLIAAVTLNEARWAELVGINASTNGSIVPVTDDSLYQVAEFWTLPNGYGDCEDFVLAKRRALLEAGWPASTLLITVVRQETGDGHAVLTVRTDRGDLILDNLVGDILVWNETPYLFLKRQSQSNSGLWVDILDGRVITVAATR